MEFLMSTILAIGSHYDDIEIGCVGTILKHIENGDDVYFAITHTDDRNSGNINDRNDEQFKSLDTINIPFKRMYRFGQNDKIDEIVGVLDILHPDIVFSPSQDDTHQHHRQTSIIAQAVARKRYTTTMFYDSGSAYNFFPNVFSIIDYEEKENILKCFSSQIKRGAINLDIVKKKNAYWASLISDSQNDYAEGFVVRKMTYKL